MGSGSIALSLPPIPRSPKQLGADMRGDRLLWQQRLAPSRRDGMTCAQTPRVVGMIVVSRDQQKSLADVLERARHDEVTYEEVGRSRRMTCPRVTAMITSRLPLAMVRRIGAEPGRHPAVRAHHGAGLTMTPEDRPDRGGRHSCSSNLSVHNGYLAHHGGLCAFGHLGLTST